MPTCGRAYEWLVARRQHRDRCDIYHAALEVEVDGERHVIESAPAWHRAAPDRGVVATGPVGTRWLGRSRWFRYEVRRWRDGHIPDVAAAVDSPCRCSTDPGVARAVLERVPAFPTCTWGRDEQHTGEMWNSNSLIAWLLRTGGADLDAVSPPPHGRAPGWQAGVVVARRRPLGPTSSRPRSGTEPLRRVSHPWCRLTGERSPSARRTDMTGQEPSLHVACPVCGAEVDEECDQPLPHLERQDLAGDPGPFPAFDLDGDGVLAWRDLDDPGHWF